MSETRYSPEQLDDLRLEMIHELGADWQPQVDAIQQAASDARVIAQLREWLKRQSLASHIRSGKPCLCDTCVTIARVLAELDRLTHPAEEAEPS